MQYLEINTNIPIIPNKNPTWISIQTWANISSVELNRLNATRHI